MVQYISNSAVPFYLTVVMEKLSGVGPPWETRDPLETLVKKAGVEFRTHQPSPGPGICSLFLVSTCLVYFHKRVRWVTARVVE